MGKPEFAHSFDAMATTYTVVISAEDADETYAAQAADAVRREVERLEGELSRFRPGSDIARLSSLQPGEAFPLGLAAWDCLSLAKALHEETGGAFDVTVGPLMRLCRHSDGEPREPDEQELASLRQRTGCHLFDLNPDSLTITLRARNMEFDLGGLGKGYALDQCRDLLEEWGIRNALLNAGDSTLLGLGRPVDGDAWIVRLDAGHGNAAIPLRDTALSASGFAVRGAHIMDPRSFRPVPTGARSFVLAPNATLADALSTAFQVLSREEAAALCSRYPEVRRLEPSQVPA